MATGKYNKLYAYNGSGVQYEITPVVLTAGGDDAIAFTGFGGGWFGSYASIDHVFST